MSAPTFCVEFSIDNAAFDDEQKTVECRRILAGVAQKLEDGARAGLIFDTCENRIGSWCFE